MTAIPRFPWQKWSEFKTKCVAEGKLPYSLTTPDEAMEHWKAQVSCPALESYSTGSSSYPTPSWAIHAPASCLSLLLLFQSMTSFFHTLSKAWCTLSLPYSRLSSSTPQNTLTAQICISPALHEQPWRMAEPSSKSFFAKETSISFTSLSKSPQVHVFGSPRTAAHVPEEFTLPRAS